MLGGRDMVGQLHQIWKLGHFHEGTCCAPGEDSSGVSFLNNIENIHVLLVYGQDRN